MGVCPHTCWVVCRVLRDLVLQGLGVGWARLMVLVVGWARLMVLGVEWARLMVLGVGWAQLPEASHSEDKVRRRHGFTGQDMMSWQDVIINTTEQNTTLENNTLQLHTRTLTLTLTLGTSGEHNTDRTQHTSQHTIEHNIPVINTP